MEIQVQKSQSAHNMKISLHNSGDAYMDKNSIANPTLDIDPK